ncbi:hypothetical protein V1522DRAFT_86612 [Lipomyces starkeyi]
MRLYLALNHGYDTETLTDDSISSPIPDTAEPGPSSSRYSFSQTELDREVDSLLHLTVILNLCIVTSVDTRLKSFKRHSLFATKNGANNYSPNNIRKNEYSE